MNIIEILLPYKYEIIIAILSLIILYLIYYVFQKDTLYSKNIRSIATVVEELNREIFYLKNQLSKTSEVLNSQQRSLSDEEIYQEIERNVYDMIQPLALTLKEMQHSIEQIDSNLQTRIAHLENGVKQISLPSSIHGNDDEKIIALYKQGVSVEAIAKELHIARNEVDFVLKINKIKV